MSDLKTVYMEIGPDGCPVRWASTPFPGHNHSAPAGDWEPGEVYVKPDGTITPLPPRTRVTDVLDPATGAWMDGRNDAEKRADWAQAVNAERDRRLASTFVFMGTTFQTDPISLSRIARASAGADRFINGKGVGGAASEATRRAARRWGAASRDFEWIASDNTVVPMTAEECVAFGAAAEAHEQSIILRARALKDGGPDSADLSDDGVWSGLPG